MKKTIKDYELTGKKVMIRVDFNVPIENGIITDDHRIKESLPTIRYAIEQQAKVILLSHLGRVETEEDLKINDLEPIALRLSELLEQEIFFVEETRGSIVEETINALENGQIVLLQNTRYEDLNGKKESKNDPELGAYWASLGDLFINDAFGTSHRAHASNVGIASHLPSGIGLLVEKELNLLTQAIHNPKRPLTVILGGSKVADKIEVIENLVKIADNILIGGGMAYTFLKASGISIGKSLYDEHHLEFCKQMLNQYCDQIILPIDSINATSVADSPIERFISDFEPNEIGFDIGHHTIKLFQQYLSESQTIIWNGPVGMFEVDAFSKGTKALCELLQQANGDVIIGGGDTGSAVRQFGYERIGYISTGGGASLELLEGKTLSGIEVIDEYEE